MQIDKDLIFDDNEEVNLKKVDSTFKEKFTDFVDELLRSKKIVPKESDEGFTDIEVSSLFETLYDWIESGKFTDTDIFFIACTGMDRILENYIKMVMSASRE